MVTPPETSSLNAGLFYSVSHEGLARPHQTERVSVSPTTSLSSAQACRFQNVHFGNAASRTFAANPAGATQPGKAHTDWTGADVRFSEGWWAQRCGPAQRAASLGPMSGGGPRHPALAELRGAVEPGSRPSAGPPGPPLTPIWPGGRPIEDRKR